MTIMQATICSATARQRLQQWKNSGTMFCDGLCREIVTGKIYCCCSVQFVNGPYFMNDVRSVYKKVLHNRANTFNLFCTSYDITLRHTVAQWLRHYATTRKVAISRPDVISFFNLPNPSGCTRPWRLLSL
jgi:hypothetical protein